MVLCEKMKGVDEAVNGTLGGPLGNQVSPRGQVILAQAGKEAAKVRGILSGDRIDFHPETAAIVGNVTHFGFGANLSFLDEEMQAHGFPFLFSRTTLDEEPRRA